jgi:2-keto-4-pentenoate hydratase/2-oxohepta-3-ene-1,7-dioic acid hydratase in catechol pathway
LTHSDPARLYSDGGWTNRERSGSATRLATFRNNGGTRIGVLDTDRAEIVDLRQAKPDLPADMLGFVRLGARGIEAARRALSSGRHRIALEEVEIRAPLPRPRRNLFCVGKNYRAHAAEFHASGFDATARDALPEAPVVFTKAPSSVIGPREPIPAHLDPSGSADYEGELALVIGAPGRGIRASEAFEHVCGYTIFNDVTARDLQTPQAVVSRQEHRRLLPHGAGASDRGRGAGRRAAAARDQGQRRAAPGRRAGRSDLRHPDPDRDHFRRHHARARRRHRHRPARRRGHRLRSSRFLKRGDRVAITIEPIGTLANPVG